MLAFSLQAGLWACCSFCLFIAGAQKVIQAGSDPGTWAVLLVTVFQGPLKVKAVGFCFILSLSLRMYPLGSVFWTSTVGRQVSNLQA